MNKTKVLNTLAHNLALFCVALIVTGAQVENRERISQNIRVEAQQIHNAKVEKITKDVAKASEGCSVTPKLTDKIVAVGASVGGPYFDDTVYTLTFDQAFGLAQQNQIWIVAYC